MIVDMCVCVPQVSFLEQNQKFVSWSKNLCMSLSIKREETERVCCVLETVSAKSLQMSEELLADDAVMSFCGRLMCLQTYKPLAASDAI